MRKAAFGSKWLDYHYDYDDPQKQASGPADAELSALSRFLFGASAPDGFRIFTIKERVFKAPEKWLTIQAAECAKEAAEQAKGRMDFCSVCKETFMANSQEVGIFVCPGCRSRSKTTTKAQDESDVA